jgi:hypothetical protein
MYYMSAWFQSQYPYYDAPLSHRCNLPCCSTPTKDRKWKKINLGTGNTYISGSCRRINALSMVVPMFTGLPSQVESIATRLTFDRHWHLSESRTKPEVLISQHWNKISAQTQPQILCLRDDHTNGTTDDMVLYRWRPEVESTSGFVPDTVDLSHWTISDCVVSCSIQLGITKIAREANCILQMCCSSSNRRRRWIILLIRLFSLSNLPAYECMRVRDSLAHFADMWSKIRRKNPASRISAEIFNWPADRANNRLSGLLATGIIAELRRPSS